MCRRKRSKQTKPNRPPAAHERLVGPCYVVMCDYMITGRGQVVHSFYTLFMNQSTEGYVQDSGV